MTQHFEQLTTNGYAIFVDDENKGDLIHECQSLEILRAGIGKGLIDENIRSDKTCWLSFEQGSAIKAYLDGAEVIRQALNRACFLNLTGFESHYALFEKGSFYTKHVDNIQGQNNRIVTYILYLNNMWQKGDGGELSLADGRLVEPLIGNSILFLSSEVSHEVLVSNKPRMSISGWFTRT